MNMKLFTKSAFKQALFCPASLYYYYDREHYANQMNEDDFLQALADGGNQVGDLAKVYYDVQPDADLAPIMGYDQSVERTKELFKQDIINIAEAAFRWENCWISSSRPPSDAEMRREKMRNYPYENAARPGGVFI